MLCVLVLVIGALTSASPVAPGTSTARYSSLGDTQMTLPQFSNETQILTKPTPRADNSRKLKRKDQQLFANFVKNNMEDLNTPNKTYKLATVTVGTVNRVKVGTRTNKPIKTSTKIAKVVPNRIVVNTTNAVKVSGVRTTTKAPFRIKLAPRPFVKLSNSHGTTKYRNITKIMSTKRPRVKPTVRRASTNEIKQNWYEEGVPYPTPNPEIISNSPPFSLNDVSNQVLENPAEAPPTDSNNAISTFNLEMAPDGALKDGAGSPCPTVHISSSVLTPQQRQDCSDLNLVINSHFHQNAATERSPLQPQTYDANPGAGGAEDVGQAEQAPPPGVAADPGGAGGASQAAAPSPGAGGTGGSGGSGGSGGDGDDGGGLHLPDFKHLFDFIKYLCDKFGHLFSFLKNPWLYLVPMILFFVVGFAAVLVFFPWWIPALFLYAGAKTAQKSNVSFYKHVHKPVHHADGWFWNHETKTWQNVAEHYQHHHNHHPQRRVDDDGLKRIEDAIKKFSQKYDQSGSQSWKWRKRNR